MTPLVSILIPCYNASATLDEALESIARQTLTDIEIVAVDDGSTDDTFQKLLAWSTRLPYLHLVAQPHSGIVAALNNGLQYCRADYIARMDADDRAYPERMARQAAFLDQHQEIDLISCQVVGFPAEDVREGFRIYLEWLNSLLEDEEIRREIFVESPLPHPSVMLRKTVVQQVGGYQDNGWPEDYDLWLRLYLSGAHFAKLAEVLLEWREHPMRLTRTDRRYSLENFLRAKAYYLTKGPLAGRDAVIMWGAGMAGRRLSKHLIRQGVPLVAFIDIDPQKIGNTRRGRPIFSPDDLPDLWDKHICPALLVSVGARGARQIIRRRLERMGLCEGSDWWGAA